MKIKNILLVSTVSLGLLAFTFNPNYNSQIDIPKESIQIDTSKEKKEVKLFEVADVEPEFPGGLDSMMSFIIKNFIYPTRALMLEITGRTYIYFIVNEDGKISEIKPTLPLEKQLGYGLEEEAMRVVSLMPDWEPGTQKGKAVKVKYTLPFNCFLEEVKEEKNEKKKKK